MGRLRTTVKLAYPVLYVLADGEIHQFDEILERVRLFVPPNKAVRTLASFKNSNRRYSRSRNQTDRQIPSRRIPDAQPEDVPPEDAVAFVVFRALTGLRNSKLVTHDRESNCWLLDDNGRSHLKQKLVAGSMANAVRISLMQRGKLI